MHLKGYARRSFSLGVIWLIIVAFIRSLSLAYFEKTSVVGEGLTKTEALLSRIRLKCFFHDVD